MNGGGSFGAPPPAAALLDEAARRDVRVGTLSRGRRRRDRAVSVLLWAAMGVAVVPLVVIAAVLVGKGARYVDWHFLTGDIPRVTGQVGDRCAGVPEALRVKYDMACGVARPAMGPAIVGTLLSTGLAALLAIPLGVLAAVYLNEVGRASVGARTVRFFADVMTGVPSVVMGLFVYTAWVVRFGTDGPSACAAALALACLMLPIVIRSTEEVLRLVPDELRHASLALGGRPWHGVTRVVVPSALPGIVSGAILAVARAAGETAPVLFTIGVTFSPNLSPFGANTTLAQQIFEGAKSGDPLAKQLAWSAAFTLVLLVFGLTLVARLLTSRLPSTSGG